MGVLLEGSFLGIGLVNLAGEVKAVEHSVIEDLNFDRLLAGPLAGMIESFVIGTGFDRSRILGIGMGIPAVIREGKVIAKAPILGIGETRDYGSVFAALERRLGFSILVENDVNVGALGEFVHRGLGEEDELDYISLGTGLGSGLILGGRLRRGKAGLAGELGYMVFDPSARQERGEVGWMESRINLSALKERFDVDIRDVESAGRGDSPKFAALRSRLVDYVGPQLALCIANSPAQLDIDLVVLGGVITEVLGQELVERVRADVERLTGLAPNVELSQSGEAGVVGAASLCTEERLADVLSDPAGGPL